MKKHFLILVSLLFVFNIFGNLYAKAVKPTKAQTRSMRASQEKKINKKKRFKRVRKKYVRHGSGLDLKKLTTESPLNEFTESPENGVNAVEKKPGL